VKVIHAKIVFRYCVSATNVIINVIEKEKKVDIFTVGEIKYKLRERLTSHVLFKICESKMKVAILFVIPAVLAVAFG